MALPAAFLALIPDIVKKGIDLVDRKFPSAVERQQAEREYERDVKETIQAAWDAEQANITERHSNDMKSDNALSKNIRPLGLIYFALLYTYQCHLGMNDKIIEITAGMLTSYIMFYVGSRGVEKGLKIYKDWKTK